MSKKDKVRTPPFVPLLHSTMDSAAWREMSHGAKSLYMALKRRVPFEHNRGYLSFRHARSELKASPRKIADWFAELQHFGFIVLDQGGCLGVEGKGKSPHWRLTEKGTTSKRSADGLPEAPTRDFLLWDGTRFNGRRKKQNPGTYGGYTPLPRGVTVPIPTGVTPQIQSVTHGVHIESEESVTHGVHISRLTTPSVSPTLPIGLVETTGALSRETQPEDDPRITSLAKWGASATKKPWTKPTILSDEPRDFSEFPLVEIAAA